MECLGTAGVGIWGIVIVQGIHHFLGSFDVQQVVVGVGLAGAQNMVKIGRDGYGGKYADNNNNNHQFNESEAFGRETGIFHNVFLGCR